MYDGYNEDIGIFESALGVIRSQIEGSQSGAIFIRERAKNQYSVVR